MLRVLLIILSLGCTAAGHIPFLLQIPPTVAFAPPLGIGAVLFKPDVKIVKSNGEDERLIGAGKFFVDAFW